MILLTFLELILLALKKNQLKSTSCFLGTPVPLRRQKTQDYFYKLLTHTKVNKWAGHALKTVSHWVAQASLEHKRLK